MRSRGGSINGAKHTEIRSHKYQHQTQDREPAMPLQRESACAQAHVCGRGILCTLTTTKNNASRAQPSMYRMVTRGATARPHRMRAALRRCATWETTDCVSRAPNKSHHDPYLELGLAQSLTLYSQKSTGFCAIAPRSSPSFPSSFARL